MTNIKTIVADDGSTGVKLAYFEGDNLFTMNVSNAAEFGRGYGEDADNTFRIDGEVTPITFFNEADSIKSKSVDYQYNAHSVAAIHYALTEAGFDGSEVSIAVTIPIEQYYTNGRKNPENIEKKKANVLRKVTPELGKGIKISDVRVYPEGIPAVRSALLNEAGKFNVDDDELTFLADMGGTTLDLCLFAGPVKKILNARSFNIGMFDAFDAVRATTGRAKARNNVIENLLKTGSAKRGSIVVDREQVTAELMNRAKNQIIDFLGDDLHELSNCFCIGGGAELLAPHLESLNLNPTIIENPVEALAVSIAEIENKRNGK